MVLFGTVLGLRITSEVIEKSTLMQFVTHNLGIGLVPQWIENISPSGLAFHGILHSAAGLYLRIFRGDVIRVERTIFPQYLPVKFFTSQALKFTQ